MSEEPTLLEGSRVYLSGPMDFVGSRILEKYLGWRSILTPLLRALRISVLDPWNKPAIKGLEPGNGYGREGVLRPKEAFIKDFWTRPETRALYAKDFWETVHIDLRMADISDFMVAFVPTNVYSVGTVHEIINARHQKKPTLLVSPPINYDLFPELISLSDKDKQQLKFIGLKENPAGLPSQWYGYIVGGHYLFDGFGWENIDLKSDNFYEQLLQQVMQQAKVNPETDNWDAINEWLQAYTPLQELTGSVLDHVTYEGKEKKLFLSEYNSEEEKKHHFFWYNTPYTPKRPLLFYLLSIAAGYIPPKTQLNTSKDVTGQIVYHSVKLTDDSWLLTSLADRSEQMRKEGKNKL